jgi:hypothetical protein
MEIKRFNGTIVFLMFAAISRGRPDVENVIVPSAGKVSFIR